MIGQLSQHTALRVVLRLQKLTRDFDGEISVYWHVHSAYNGHPPSHVEWFGSRADAEAHIAGELQRYAPHAPAIVASRGDDLPDRRRTIYIGDFGSPRRYP